RADRHQQAELVETDLVAVRKMRRERRHQAVRQLEQLMQHRRLVAVRLVRVVDVFGTLEHPSNPFERAQRRAPFPSIITTVSVSPRQYSSDTPGQRTLCTPFRRPSISSAALLRAGWRLPRATSKSNARSRPQSTTRTS